MGDPRQVHINTGNNASNTFDAIVVGSGISGGWAAKELCGKGLRTLLLERGRNVTHIKDYPTSTMHPWEFPNRLQQTVQERQEDPIQCQGYDEGSKPFYVRDQEHPYVQLKPFYWFRGYQLGGRSLTWGRQTYRLSDWDFEANAKDGVGVDWPIRYRDLEQWYSYVETYAGISGKAEGLSQLPDGVFLPPMDMNCVEEYFKKSTEQKFHGRSVIHSRVANLTRGWNGRGPCQYRNLCDRGCPFGGYFSSNAATIPAADATGLLTLRTNAIAVEVLYDRNARRATGVRVVDTVSKQVTEYFARIIFVNASTIPTAALLLNSRSSEFPEGLGNSSGQLGRNLMDHHASIGATGDFEGFKDQYYSGRRPTGIYIPRYVNLDEASRRKDFTRGYAFQGNGARKSWQDTSREQDDFGLSLKQRIAEPGNWHLLLSAFGECLPNPSNRVTLHPDKKDQWGLPLVQVEFSWGENEKVMRKHMQQDAVQMLEAAGFKNVNAFDYDPPGGNEVHEMGTARMGTDPRTSVLNANNQLQDVKNVFITDGSCMTSSACQNPSLTYMALTARACDFAFAELKKGSL